MGVIHTYLSTGKTAAFFFFLATAGWDAAGWEAAGLFAAARGAKEAARLGATEPARLGATDEARVGATEPARIAADTGYPAGKATPAAARAASASRHPFFLRPPGLRPSSRFFWISTILKQRVVQCPSSPGSIPGGGGTLGVTGTDATGTDATGTGGTRGENGADVTARFAS